MTDNITVRHPIVIALIVGIATFFLLNHFNPNLPEKKRRRKKCNKILLDEPKEINGLVSVLVSMMTWYYLQSKNKRVVSSQGIIETTGLGTLTKLDQNNLSLSENSSDARKSYNLLGKGLQLPNGQVLPDIFHKIS